jgi:palmitoyltransferase ZDHHC1/11
VKQFFDSPFEIDEDEFPWECTICNTHVSRFAKHCGTCNRCVDHFDHHCPFVNNCIGKRNYWKFIVLTFSLLLQSWMHFVMTLPIIMTGSINNPYFFLMSVVCNLIVAVFITALAGFHLLLIYHNATTYDYLKAREEVAESNKKL